MRNGPRCTAAGVQLPAPSTVRRWKYQSPSVSVGLAVLATFCSNVFVAGGSVAAKWSHATAYPPTPLSTSTAPDQVTVITLLRDQLPGVWLGLAREGLVGGAVSSRESGR